MMSLEEQADVLSQQQAQIDQIIDTLILDSCCDEERFCALFNQLWDMEIPYVEGLRSYLKQMRQEGKVFGAMAEAYERSIDEMHSRHEALMILLCEFRERRGLASFPPPPQH